MRDVVNIPIHHGLMTVLLTVPGALCQHSSSVLVCLPGLSGEVMSDTPWMRSGEIHPQQERSESIIQDII